LYVRIDRKRKFYGTVFLRALGLKTDSDIIRAFYKLSNISLKNGKLLVGRERKPDWHEAFARHCNKAEQVVPQGRKITNSVYARNRQKAKIDQVEVASNDLEGAYVAADVIDMSTGEVMVEANHELTPTTSSASWRKPASPTSKSSSPSATKPAT
jgi:DNA-directed RNA polymerase subunit beta